MKHILFILMIITAFRCNAQTKISSTELSKWDFYGKGSVIAEPHDQVLLKEGVDSKGVMLISPQSYSENVVMKYKVMGLTPATVLVALVSVSDFGETTELKIPVGYDGSIQHWFTGCDNYFFAFHNAAHNVAPFVRTYEQGKGKLFLDMAKKNVMQAGVYYDVEVGRDNDRLWLKVDGKTILKCRVENPYGGGHLALRIRGTGSEYAACLIKDLVIIEK